MLAAFQTGSVSDSISQSANVLLLNFSSLCNRKFNFPDFQHNYVKRVPQVLTRLFRTETSALVGGNGTVGPVPVLPSRTAADAVYVLSRALFFFYEDPPLYGGPELPAMASLAGWQPGAAGTAGRKKKETLSHVFIPRFSDT